MLLIANRGNLFGRNLERENSPDYLNEAINQGYHVMVDAWWVEGCFWFGKNRPTHKPIGGGIDWLTHAVNSVWIRAKSAETFVRAHDLGLNVFWQQSDMYAYSTWGHLLGFYGAEQAGEQFVHVIPAAEIVTVDSLEIDQFLRTAESSHALCCDHVGSVVNHLLEPSCPHPDPRHVSSSQIA
jgi:hypothetical protein